MLTSHKLTSINQWEKNPSHKIKQRSSKKSLYIPWHITIKEGIMNNTYLKVLQMYPGTPVKTGTMHRKTKIKNKNKNIREFAEFI